MPIGKAAMGYQPPNNRTSMIPSTIPIVTVMRNAMPPVERTLPYTTSCCLGAASTPHAVRRAHSRPYPKIAICPTMGIQPTNASTSSGFTHPLSRVSIFHEDANPSCCAYITNLLYANRDVCAAAQTDIANSCSVRLYECIRLGGARCRWVCTLSGL